MQSLVVIGEWQLGSVTCKYATSHCAVAHSIVLGTSAQFGASHANPYDLCLESNSCTSR